MKILRIQSLLQHRFGMVTLVVLFAMATGLQTRLILFAYSFDKLELSILSLPGIFLVGSFYDLVVGFFFAVPVAWFTWLMKDSLFRKRFAAILIFLQFFIIASMLLLNICAEVAFWDEFNVRFNFIAVDYLIYTTEVISNIWQSYNMPMILSLVLLLSATSVFLLRRHLLNVQNTVMRFGARTKTFLLIMAITASGYFFVNNEFKQISGNNYVNELAGNGIYEFGAAFWHNEIDYPLFYPLQDMKASFAIIKEKLDQGDAMFTSDSLDIRRKIVTADSARPWNIILISVESLSGDYLATFGNTQNITPKLDSLIPHGLFFSDMYAAGTRTVRGLEAISLSLPPTPGQSVVRRPFNENLNSLGAILGDKGYDVKYIYGGNSFFDNMGYFFSHNGYKVIDQRDFPEDMIHHTTAWGVADEDAFSMAMQEADISFASGKLFFNHIMTVSNHRPYTYPEGRIDIPPSAQSREGAVKYCDFSIDQFIQASKQKPWFKNTLFVIVSDHCSRSAGKTSLPISNYHIPCLIYNPGLIKPQKIEKPVSQIDLAPTLLGLLRLSYESDFMGFDVFNMKEGQERAFVSTYEKLGFLRNDSLVVLSPVRKIELYKVDRASGENIPLEAKGNIVQEAIAWYQTASFLVKQKQQKNKLR